MRHIGIWAILLTAAGAAQAGPLVVDFESLAFSAALDYENGAHLPGGFVAGGVTFNNTFTDFGGFSTWSGFSYSRVHDATTPGFANQYAAFAPPAGRGAGASSQYAVGYVSVFDPPPAITLPAGFRPRSLTVTNTTYAALSMRDGDGFAKKFGGESGLDQDFFRLTITGRDARGAVVGTVEFYLADYRGPGIEERPIVDEWKTVDLDHLRGAVTLGFGLDSTDNDPVFGMNTPAYFALDDLTLSLIGDADGDCRVAAADYTLWAAQFGQTGAGLSADFDANGDVGASDYALWAANFGRTCPAGSVPVPEPTSGLLAIVTLGLGLASRLPRRIRARRAGVG